MAQASLPAISLFSGVGGLDLGVSRSGFDIRTAVEFDRDSAASLRATYGVAWNVISASKGSSPTM